MMKKIIALGILAVFISSCGGIKTSSQGISNDAFLEFIGNQSEYSEGVEVIIDNNTPFNAQVKKPNYNGFRKKVYALSKGTHEITVSHKNKIILKQRIFISINETKKLVLP
jgi:hypothetical protein